LPLPVDVDNRVKTIVDALRIPTDHDGYENLKPKTGETPFFCLMDDDRQISKLSIESGRLLIWPPSADASYAHVTLTVHIKPENLTWNNIGF
jgi:hypothetical protein